MDSTRYKFHFFASKTERPVFPLRFWLCIRPNRRGRANLGIKVLKIVLVLFLIKTSVYGAVLAAETNRLSIYPTNFKEDDPKTRSWFILEFSPGQTQLSEVTVENKSGEAVSLEIYAVDATSNKDGAFTLFPKGTKEDAGGWINLDRDNLELAAHSKMTVPFSISVPRLATPGDHVAGIAIEPKSKAVPPSSGVSVVQRLGVRVYLTVKGERIKRLEISDLKVVGALGGGQLAYSLSNLGNTNLPVSGNLVVRSVFGQETLIRIADLTEILAGKTVSGKVSLAAVKPFSFSAKLVVDYGGMGAEKSVVLAVIPAALLAVLVFAVVIVLLLTVLKRRRGFSVRG